MKLEEVVKEQFKHAEESKREIIKHIGELAHGSTLDMFLRHKADYENRVKEIRGEPKHNVQSVYRERVGLKEFLTFHMSTITRDGKRRADFFTHYGKYEHPLFLESGNTVDGKPKYEIDEQEMQYFIEFSKKNWDDLKEFTGQNTKLYIKSSSGTYGPFRETDWLTLSYEDLEELGRGGTVVVRDGDVKLKK